MPPSEPDFSSFPAVAGVRLAVASAGIKRTDRPDLALIELVEGANTAAVFTRNAFCAAPVLIAREHLQTESPRYLLINSGNANAGTGDNGLHAARACCQSLAELSGCSAQAVLPFSTGVIGQDLPVERMTPVFPALLKRLDATNWDQAARAIMTTDTVAKAAWRQIGLNGETVTLAGIAKGAGMIKPDMATMLAYVATDAAVTNELLRTCLQTAVDASFNRITVDGDTSTNDACVLMATGKANVSVAAMDETYAQFCNAVTEICVSLARQIIADGEGATKLVTVSVSGGADTEECKTVAYTIAHSPLVKTAFFASDPNWGRILAAVGRAGLVNLNIDAVKIFLDDVCIVEQGGRAASYTEEQGQAVVSRDSFTVKVELDRGSASADVITCDLSYDYVRINAEYRT
jgi:glutamate N-acetyltransferase/amino-acid N-acetyltransferase